MPKQFPCPVTTIFSRRVKPGFEQQYEEWLRGINAVSAQFPGAQGTTVVRPGHDQGEFVAIVQFDSIENLDRWIESPERAAWLEKLGAITLDSEEVASMTGMERWFTLPNRSVTQAPPRYKSALLLLLGLYPSALVVGWMLQPLLAPLPRSLQLLVSQMVLIPIMVWLIMPQLTRLFFAWLYPEHEPHQQNSTTAAK